MFSFRIWMHECKHSNFTFWDFKILDAYKKRFIPQNGQGTVLKYSPIWKTMRKSIKTSELKAQVHSQKEALKWEAMALSAGKGTLLSLWKKSWNRKG